LIVVDADCRLANDALSKLAHACAASGRPTQALYIMTAPAGTLVNHQVAEFAWRIKNHVRPAGLRALGLPCQLMGTGMAFPWSVISRADLASGEVVEDLKLGLDLAAAGSPPLFHPSAVVQSQFPHSASGAAEQRRRWEHGHISLLVTDAPRLIYAGIRRRSLSLLALALDLAVPPLSLLALLVVGGLMISALAALLGFSPVALLMSAANLAVFAATVFIGWWVYGRDVLPARFALAVGPYVAGKAGSYPGALLRKSRLHWTRADRRNGA
jgi:cellulose synthase/poly-beta-1,6-N-acetylglucosamine synthase-like glycosyltransferase